MFFFPYRVSSPKIIKGHVTFYIPIKKEIWTLGPTEALNFRKLTDLISYFFIVFTILPIMFFTDWFTFIDLQYPQEPLSAKMTLFMKQSILGCYWTILHPLTEVKGLKYCSNGQQAKSGGHSSNISSDKTLEKQIRRRNASRYQNSGK